MCRLCLLALVAGGAGFLVCVASPSALAGEGDAQTAQAVDPYQILFSIGMRELQTQNYPAAVQVFEMLSRKVGTQRVKLELARACYLDRQYSRAKEIFEGVLRDPALPWGVRENVNRYLDLIDESLGSVKISLAFVSDSNPINYTDHREITIAGQTLRLTPPPTHKTAHGIRYGVNVTHAFTGDASVVGFLDLNFRDFEGRELDKWVIDTGLGLFPYRYRKFQGRLGVEDSTYGGDHLYRQPYASLTYIPDPVEQFRLSAQLKLAYLDAAEFDYLDGPTQTLGFRASRILANATQVLGDLYLENASTDEAAYSYRGAGLGATLSVPIAGTWGMGASASLGKRDYQDTDPVFGETRQDLTQKMGLTVYNRRWKVSGLTPEIGVAYERTDSSIDYYEYDKIKLVLGISE